MPFEHLLYCLIGFLSAYLGSFVSGGIGAISLSGLLIMGIPPGIAKSNIRLASFGAMSSGLIELYRAKYLPKRQAFLAFFICLSGTYIGTSLMIITPSIWLMRWAWVFLMAYALHGLYKKRQEGVNQINTTKRTTSQGRIFIINSLQFCTSILSGFIPGMTGGINHILYTQWLWLNILEYKSLSKVIWVAWVLWSLIPILQNNLIKMSILIPLLIGMWIGGYAGTKHLLKLGHNSVERIALAWILFMGLGICLFGRV